MAIKRETIDELLDGEANPQSVFSSARLPGELNNTALAERILDAETDEHLREQDKSSANHHSRYCQKAVLTRDGEPSLEIPRDRRRDSSTAADCEVPTTISLI